VKVVGVEPEAAPTLFRALAAGRPVDAEAGGIAADSLAPRRVGTLMFPIAQQHIAQVIPHAKLVTYPDAAHGFFFQESADFLPRLTAFLR